MTVSNASPRFGDNAKGYRLYRPAYPQAVYDTIDRYHQGPSQRLFDIGAGTGLATSSLLGDGSRSVTAIEPDTAMATLLPQSLSTAQQQRVSCVPARFEDLADPEERYDGGRAATSMHWLAPQALSQVRRWLRPGGSWAMWWTVYGDPNAPDAFMQASAPLFSAIHSPPAAATPYALHSTARCSELDAAGFTDVRYQCFEWECTQDTEQVLGLSATFPAVMALDGPARQPFMSALADLVNQRFGGRVQRRFLTPLYLATAP